MSGIDRLLAAARARLERLTPQQAHAAAVRMLKEGGAKVQVTEENKQEYVRLVVSYRLDNSIKQQIKAFLEGFYE